MLSADGAIDRDAMLEALTSEFAEDSGVAFAELHEPLLDECLERMDGMLEEFKQLVANNEKADPYWSKCNPKVDLLFDCLVARYVRQCPASAWDGCECIVLVTLVWLVLFGVTTFRFDSV